MRVLILHASAGAGHKSAAQAIEKAYRTLADAPETRVIDALDFAPSWFRKMYTQSFESSVKHAPWAFGAAYHTSSQAVRLQSFRGLRRAFNRIAGQRAVADGAFNHRACGHLGLALLRLNILPAQAANICTAVWEPH